MVTLSFSISIIHQLMYQKHPRVGLFRPCCDRNFRFHSIRLELVNNHLEALHAKKKLINNTGLLKLL